MRFRHRTRTLATIVVLLFAVCHSSHGQYGGGGGGGAGGGGDGYGGGSASAGGSAGGKKIQIVYIKVPLSKLAGQESAPGGASGGGGGGELQSYAISA